MIIISLFQEDTIFCTNANIYNMYRAGEVSVHRACCERATQPYSLGGEVRFDQAQDQQVVTTRSPRIVTECLLTFSMLIKMYIYAIYGRFRIGTILSIRKHGYKFTLSLLNLLSPFSLSCPPPSY